MRQNKTRPSAERGNVFMFILLGVVLFGALAFIIARSMRSDTTTSMSQRKAELIAVDVLSFGQRLERAVAKLQRNGVSENDISFDNPVEGGYLHTPAQPDNHNIFHASGGGMTWQKPPAAANNGSPWIFTGSSCIVGVGNGGSGCATNSASDEDLIAVLPNMNATVCLAIARKMQLSDIPENTGGAYSTTKFTGSFTDGTEINTGAAHNAACYKDGDDYHFYYVLIAR